MDVTFLCREVDKDTGEIAVYPVATVTDGRDLLLQLDVRQRLNPELRYFAVFDQEYRINKDMIEKVLGRSELPCSEALSSHHIIRI